MWRLNLTICKHIVASFKTVSGLEISAMAMVSEGANSTIAQECYLNVSIQLCQFKICDIHICIFENF